MNHDLLDSNSHEADLIDINEIDSGEQGSISCSKLSYFILRPKLGEYQTSTQSVTNKEGDATEENIAATQETPKVTTIGPMMYSHSSPLVPEQPAPAGEVLWCINHGNWGHRGVVSLGYYLITDDGPQDYTNGEEYPSGHGHSLWTYIRGSDGDNVINGSGCYNGKTSNHDPDIAAEHYDHDDYIDGRGGDDVIYGREGDDTLFGGTGNDILFGGKGDDYLDGGDGDDVLYGGKGTDRIIGGKGDDWIASGPLGNKSNDCLTGGEGFDTFIIGEIEQSYWENVNWAQWSFGMAGALLGDAIHTGLDLTTSGKLLAELVPMIGEIANSYVDFAGRDTFVTPPKASMVDITDFDPTRDVIIIPLDENSKQGVYMSTDKNWVGDFSFTKDTENTMDRILDVTIANIAKELGIAEVMTDDMLAAFVVALKQNAILIHPDGAYVGLDNMDEPMEGFDPAQLKDLKDLGGAFLIVGAYGGWTVHATEESPYVMGNQYDDILIGYDPINFTNEDNGTKKLYGFDGDDLFLAGPGNNYVYGGDGSDTIAFLDSNEGIYVDMSGKKQDNNGDWYFEARNGHVWYNYQDGVRTKNEGIDNNYDVENVVGSKHDDTIIGDEADNILSGGDGDDTISGGDGNDTLYGNKGDDTLYGGAGDDTLKGGWGTDTFVFDSDFGNDIINDFETSRDIIELNGLGVSSFAELQGYFEQKGDDLVIDFGDGNSITLENVSKEDLTADDFRFTEVSQMRTGSNDFTTTTTTTTTTDSNEPITQTGIETQAAAGSVVRETPNVIMGTEPDDYGRGGHDVLWGTDGPDKIYGLGGDDWLLGGAGNDVLYGGTGNDYLFGEEGDDVLYGGNGDDVQEGGSGNDVLYGGNGDDHLDGGAGNDELDGGKDNDKLHGGDGNDKLDGGSGDDVLKGGTGDDYLYGGSGNDKLYGGAGNDELDGGTGNDRLYGGAGDDTLYGGWENDYLDGGGGDDKLYGDAGDDELFGRGGNDELWGGDGNDYLDGGWGDDTLWGGDGNDVLYGGDGENGNDTLYGGAGDDTLRGGAGDDKLYGGTGNDTFIFDPDFGNDAIFDFETSGDIIELNGLGVSSFAELQNYFEQKGGNLVIDFGDGNSITLEDVNKNDMTADEFRFINVEINDAAQTESSQDDLLL